MKVYFQIFYYGGFIWAVIALILLLNAWESARKGNIVRHQLIMMILTLGGWIFILGYLVRYRFPEYIPNVPPEYIPWLAFHGSVGIVTLIGATYLVWGRLTQSRTPNRQSHVNKYHQIYGRIFIALWGFTHLGGLVNFFLFSQP